MDWVHLNKAAGLGIHLLPRAMLTSGNFADLGRALRWGAAFPLVIATGIQCSPLVFSVTNEAFKW